MIGIRPHMLKLNGFQFGITLDIASVKHPLIGKEYLAHKNGYYQAIAEMIGFDDRDDLWDYIGTWLLEN